MIVRRFEAATGNQAVLVETGETVEALATQGWNRRWAKAGSSCRRPVAEERSLLPVKRAGACTAEVRGSNPLRSTRKSAQIDVISKSAE